MNNNEAMNLTNTNTRAMKVLRVCLMCLLMGVLLTVPAFAANEYAEKGAQWILDGIYWVALVVIVWQLFRNVAAKNISGAVIMAVLGALCIVLIVNPEVLKTFGEKLMSTVGLSS